MALKGLPNAFRREHADGMREICEIGRDIECLAELVRALRNDQRISRGCQDLYLPNPGAAALRRAFDADLTAQAIPTISLVRRCCHRKIEEAADGTAPNASAIVSGRERRLRARSDAQPYPSRRGRMLRAPQLAKKSEPGYFFVDLAIFPEAAYENPSPIKCTLHCAVCNVPT